jgi:type III secretion system PrgH/EprH family protein
MANRLTPADAGSTYVLKILFGPLCGLELSLSAGRYFFVTANARDDPHALGESALKNADQTFWVPGGFGMADDRSPSSTEWQTTIPNFAIDFAESARIEIFSPAGPYSREISIGSVFQSDGIRLAFRHAKDPWPDTFASAAADDGRNPPRPADEAAAGGGAGHSASPGMPQDGQNIGIDACNPAHEGSLPTRGSALAENAQAPSPKPSPRKWRVVAMVSVIAGFAAAGLHAAAPVDPARSGALTVRLTEQLHGSPNPAVVRHGRDGKVYVLVATPRDAAWVLQALHKAGGGDQVQVRIEDHEISRLESILKQRSVQFFKLRFDRPAQPTLLLNRDSHPEDSDWSDALRQALLDAMPYADDLKMERHPLAFIDDKARAGLDAMQIPYRPMRQGSWTTYQITRSLDDAELSALGVFARDFAHNWGTQQIRFKFEAGEEGPQGQSYRYGSSNYVSTGGDRVRFVEPVL